MMNIGRNRITQGRVVKLMTQETGTYNQQYSRPYNTVMDGQVIKILTDRLGNSINNMVTPDSFSGVTGSFMSPSAAPEGEIGIVNGWDTRRFRFLMQVEFMAHETGVQTHYILGYTDFNGISHAHSYAPDMVFYINSIVQTRKSYVDTPMGVREIETVVDSSQLFGESGFSSIYAPNHRYTMRPQDIVTNIATSHLSSPYNDENGSSLVMDTTSMLRTEAMKSRRTNNLASTYLAGLMNGYVKSATTQHDFGDPDTLNSTMQTLDHTRGRVTDHQAPLDPFLQMMTASTGRPAGNSFTFAELTRFDPNVDNVSEHFVVPPQLRDQMGTAGSTSYWNGKDSNTHASAVLSQSVPAIMMSLLITKIVFESSNHTQGGRPATVISHGVGFTNTDMQQNWLNFIERFEREVMSNITFDYSIGYYVKMIVDLLGETKISIKIGNNPLVDFVVPSFCDNLLAPVITLDKALPRNVAHQFEALFGEVNEMLQPQNKSYDFNVNTIV